MPTPRRNRVKLIRWYRRAEFDSTRVTVPDRRAQAAGFAALCNTFRSREIPGLPSSFAVFCPGWASVEGGGDARRGLRSSPMSLVRSLYNGCVIARDNGGVIVRGGFGGLAFDSMWERRVGGREPLVGVPTPISRCQLKLFKNTEYNQCLAEKLQSQTRVICATPFGKGAD